MSNIRTSPAGQARRFAPERWHEGMWRQTGQSTPVEAVGVGYLRVQRRYYCGGYIA